MHRLARATLAVLILAISASMFVASPASAQDDDRIIIDVLEVSGLIDPVQVASILDRLAEAEQSGSLAFILRVNSTGVTVSDDEFADLLAELDTAELVVAVWVGQTGSSATGKSALLLSVADISGIAPGSKVGNVGTTFQGQPLPEPFASFADRTTQDLGAVQAGLVDTSALILGDMVLQIEPLVDVQLAEIADVDAEVPQRQLVEGVTVRFLQLSLVDQLFHTVASPAVAYLLLLIGLSMILLDFYTAGIGVAGVVGAVCLTLSSYGLGVLSIRPWALVVLVLSVGAYAIDIQTGVPRFWTGMGTLMLLVGSFSLFDVHGLSWVPLVVGIGLTLVFMLSGMPSLVRTRFSTTTIGREWMVGEMGIAVTEIDPDGTVEVRGAKWRARTNRGTPLEAGVAARVVAIEGTILEVEPELGGAIDYREMRGSDK
ncbi:MAG: hypothetical protein GXP35_06910 [Actinobacteria bacterium]|nr:hypothetical protein [Actinomycetota bacterium]